MIELKHQLFNYRTFNKSYINKKWITEENENIANGRKWTWYEMTTTLAKDIVRGNIEYEQNQGFRVESKRKDEVHEAYCKYALLKKKLKFNLYDNIEKLLQDTKEVQELNKVIGDYEVLQVGYED